MTDADFERFSERLDREWMRARLATVVTGAEAPEQDLERMIREADPLGTTPARRPGVIRELFGSWPSRFAVAATVAALVLIGFVLGRIIDHRAPTVMTMAPPLPAYVPGPASTLALAPTFGARADERFRAAMAFHPTPEFASKALPLLREAVRFDPTHDQAQFWLGVALLQSDQAQAAVLPLEEAVRLGPADSAYKQYLLFAYLRTGAVKRATALLLELMRGSRR